MTREGPVSALVRNGCNEDTYDNWSDGGSDDCGLVDGDGSWVLWLDSGFVGLDVGSVSKGISDVVDSSDSAIGISESIGTNNLSKSVSSFSSEGTTGSVVFVVSESVVAQVLWRKFA